MKPDSPAAAVIGVVAALDALQVPWFLTGSIASSLHGIPRSTNDIDIVAILAPHAAQAFVDHLGAGYYADEAMIRNGFLRRRACNVIWLETMMKVDLMPPRFAFDEEAMARRVRTHLSDGAGETIEVSVATAEDVILAKLVWYREGGHVSQRQLGDIRGILAAQAGRLDMGYLEGWAGRLGLAELLQAAWRAER